MEQNNTKKSFYAFVCENKTLVAAVCALVVALLIGACVFVLNAPSSDGSEPESIVGVYSMAVEVGSSAYTFYDDGTGERSYITDGETVTEDFTYLISGSGDSRTITFTWKKSGEVKTHSYATGSLGEKEFIMINGVEYYKQ